MGLGLPGIDSAPPVPGADTRRGTGRRGLPADVSGTRGWAAEGSQRPTRRIGNASWIGWDEIRALDMTVSARICGDGTPPFRYFVDGDWPTAAPRSPFDGYGAWQVDGVTYGYRRLTSLEPCVRRFRCALAGICGDDGIRLAGWFE